MIKIHVHVDEATADRAKKVGSALKSRKVRIALAATLLAIPAVVIAAPLTVPNSFSAGNVISSAEMNENFAAVKTAIDDNDSRVTAVEARLDLANCAWATAGTSPSDAIINTLCPPNNYAISGSCAFTNPLTAERITYSRPYTTTSPFIVQDGDPAATPDGWACGFSSANGGSRFGAALCCPF